MSSSRFLDRLNSGQRLVADGATGTNLQSARFGKWPALRFMGIGETAKRSSGCTVILWTAGADIILTASFGGTTICLEAHRFGRTGGRDQPAGG